ncbi:MAG TPA: PilZ domain-containing protein [Candidatus Eisenbacteria bacterium]|nr:PilZ domain-containing protein [Candidatus Eisenbacteria bacterium]
MPQKPKVERRKLRRILKRIPASFEAGQVRGKGHIKNVSKEGLFLRTSVLPNVGDEVRVIFPDRTGSKIEARGTVRWTTLQLPVEQQAKPGFGVHVPRGNEAFDDFFEQILLG